MAHRNIQPVAMIRDWMNLIRKRYEKHWKHRPGELSVELDLLKQEIDMIPNDLSREAYLELFDEFVYQFPGQRARPSTGFVRKNAMELSDYLKLAHKKMPKPKLTGWEKILSLKPLSFLVSREPNPIHGQDVYVRGTLLSHEVYFDVIGKSLFVQIMDKNRVITDFRKPFGAANMEDPTKERYAEVLDDLLDQKAVFVVHSYKKGGIAKGYYHFIEGIVKNGGIQPL